MKAVFRSAPVQGLLAGLIWLYMATLGRTIRWQVEGMDKARACWSDERGFIAAAWHSRILILPTAWTRYARHWDQPKGPLAILISLSRDGGFVATAAHMLGLKVIRGSAANKKKRDKDKGGAAAIREAGELLGSGGAVCITLDGPRGPNQRAGIGPILIAKKKRVPILIYALASSPARRLKSWDRFLLPAPFGKGAIVFDGPIEIPRDEDAETLRLRVEERMNAATRRAEELVGLRSIDPAPLQQSLTKAPAE